ncbi:MAG: LysR family transcriptional regulator [Paludibacterium sp.]|uniref:LysR substrate-binding domain-containing protein n=1 Tax=Paludibacterium sp. TaxID=1917523 RepID=UPI0025EA0567|nr:LysR family transcriptional regulator [Paludibacterium sp.]MBV8045863.1 LysR family transcriptional regulator [Paludibacterium sp.]MBV8646777.1 LysR family transcriptional regulator [Paludibacterium sp.]
MDRLDAMRVFVRVAETGSFTRTADSLALPRATVSAAIQQLEAEWATRLFHRTTRRVQLSRDGETALERCRQLLVELDELQGHFASGEAPLTGRLKVEAPSRFARNVLAPALPSFLADHPELTLELGSSDRQVDLVREGVDCVLRVGALVDSSLVARPLGEMAMINCASPGYLAQHGTPQHPSDLSRHWMVNYAVSPSGKVSPWSWQQAGREHHLDLPGRVTVDSAEMYVACALAGMGLIQIPAHDVDKLIATGALVEVLADWHPSPMPIWAVYPHRRHVPRRVQLFIDWLQGLMAGQTG